MQAQGNPDVKSKVLQVQWQALNRLIEQHDNMIQSNSENIETHEKFRAEYVTLRGHLKKIGDKLEHEALVPLGPKVLAFGKIIHTNEITCLLGDNWFIECTAKKAVQIVTHRIKKCDEMLQKLKKEHDLFTSWKSEAHRQLTETLEESGSEIIEEFDEEKEKQWRIEHKEKVRKYHQDLNQKRRANDFKEDKELFERLEVLELEEYLAESFGIQPDPDDQQTRQFDEPKPVRELKSILKKTPNRMPDKTIPTVKQSDTATPMPPEQQPINIIERQSLQPPKMEGEVLIQTELTEPKPKHVSKFKQMRLMQHQGN